MRALDLWSIPAWAGETSSMTLPAMRIAVYPRVGGGNEPLPIRTEMLGGLSPRGRGKPTGTLIDGVGDGSIPAWAGETGQCA